ncbi:MAG: MarR family transcriptional regulator [Chloroflexi bacterium]|nr:MarR family transcriptional regulator [Chloroflexota bacterium]
MPGTDTLVPDEIRGQVAGMLQRVSRALRDPQDEAWLAIDLSMAQVKLLFTLHYRGPATVGALAERLGVKLPTVSVTTDRLVRLGYVRRLTDEDDRRVVISQITTEGSRVVERLREERRARIDQIVSRLTPQELLALSESLEPVARILSEMKTSSQRENGLAQP